MHFRSSKPIFRQILDHLIELIITKEWRAGERILSVRDLASEIEVNPNTVARTYTLLGELGIVHTKRGVGYFLDKNAHQLAQQYLKRQFEKEELPRFAHMIKLLEIDPQEIIKILP